MLKSWRYCLTKSLCACLLIVCGLLFFGQRSITRTDGNIHSSRVILTDDNRPGYTQNTKNRHREKDSLPKSLTVSKENNASTHQTTRSENGLPQAITFIDDKWKLTDLCKPYSHFLNNPDFPLVNYKSSAGKVKLFIHNPSKDGISSLIKRYGAFEINTINRVLFELKRDPELQLIDIGTNVGQHSIAAALIGRDSIAIDAAVANVEHVCASAHYLKVGKKITLIHNIISDNHDQHAFRYSKGGDYGSVHVDADGIWDKMRKKYGGYFKNETIKQSSMMLDDILQLPQIKQFKKVFIKMDVEGHEHRVLLGAKEFFKQIDIHGIVMEWEWHKNRQSADVIKNLLSEWQFIPFQMKSNSEAKLDLKSSNNWPQDVLWKPIKYLS